MSNIDIPTYSILARSLTHSLTRFAFDEVMTVPVFLPGVLARPASFIIPDRCDIRMHLWLTHAHARAQIFINPIKSCFCPLAGRSTPSTGAARLHRLWLPRRRLLTLPPSDRERISDDDKRASGRVRAREPVNEGSRNSVAAHAQILA